MFRIWMMLPLLPLLGFYHAGSFVQTAGEPAETLEKHMQRWVGVLMAAVDKWKDINTHEDNKWHWWQTITMTRILTREEMVGELLLVWPDTKIIWAAPPVTHLSPKPRELSLVFLNSSDLCILLHVRTKRIFQTVCVNKVPANPFLCLAFPGEWRGTWRPFSPHQLFRFYCIWGKKQPWNCETNHPRSNRRTTTYACLHRGLWGVLNLNSPAWGVK